MQQLAALQQLFGQYLRAHSLNQPPTELYEPVNYIMNTQGKRLRPVLVLAACQLFQEDVTKALPAALAIEMFHNFSLVHDDIMDEAPLRRGQLTVHRRYGVNAGILSGDVMLIHAYQYLLQVEDAETVKRLVSVFNRIAIMVCEGQQYDVNFETRTDVSIAEYTQMIAYKTAALIAGGLQMGAIVAGASEESQQKLYDFGWDIGIAFQLQDDYLDTFGDPKQFGKRLGGDIVQNKKTFMILKALELGSDQQRATLQEQMKFVTTNEEDKIEVVSNILKALRIPELTQAEKEHYRQRAYTQLAAVAAPEEKKKLLFDLADSLVQREI